MYAARTGDFSVRVPRSIFGTRVEEDGNDEGNWVHFSSDDGSVWRIEFYPIPPNEAERFAADSARRDGLTRGFLFDVVVPDYETRNPGTEVLHSEFVSDSLGRAYFGVLRVPGGSAAVQMAAEGPQRLEAIMHTLLFVKEEWFYLLKLIPGELTGGNRAEPDLSPTRVLAFRNGMVFRSPD
jgi:hypothetical protein